MRQRGGIAPKGNYSEDAEPRYVGGLGTLHPEEIRFLQRMLILYRKLYGSQPENEKRLHHHTWDI